MLASIMWRFARMSPRSTRFASSISWAAVSSFVRPMSRRKRCNESLDSTSTAWAGSSSSASASASAKACDSTSSSSISSTGLSASVATSKGSSSSSAARTRSSRSTGEVIVLMRARVRAGCAISFPYCRRPPGRHPEASRTVRA
jgi:hypothetical protein